MKERLKEKEKINDSKEREEYLRRNGYSQQRMVQLKERWKDIILDLATRKEQVREQEQVNKITDANLTPYINSLENYVFQSV